MIRWFSPKRLIMPLLLVLFLVVYFRTAKQKHHQSIIMDNTAQMDQAVFVPVRKETSLAAIAQPPSKAKVVQEKSGPVLDNALLQKPFITSLNPVSLRPFELTDSLLKREFGKWDQQRTPLKDFLWTGYNVIMLPVAKLPDEQNVLFQIFRQSIVRHVSIFYGDYRRAGGTEPRHFSIPECSEIGLGRDDNESASKLLDSLAGSQGDIKFKQIAYYEEAKKGQFLAEADGSVLMVTKYFKIKEKGNNGEPDKKKEKKLKEKSRQNYLRELSALKALNHPHIVHGICTNEAKLQIVYPFLKGGDLVPLEEDALGLRVTKAGGRTSEVLNPDKTFLPRFTEQLVSAVAHMHQQGFVHFDLKPENLVVAGPDRYFTRPSGSEELSAYHLVLIDFGLSELESRLGDDCVKSGTEVTMAPEQVMCNNPVGFPTDWWGVAAALYRVRVFWEPSITEKERSALLHLRDKQWGHVILPPQPFFSPEFTRLQELMLRPNPEDREFDDDLGKLLKHPYLITAKI